MAALIRLDWENACDASNVPVNVVDPIVSTTFAAERSPTSVTPEFGASSDSVSPGVQPLSPVTLTVTWVGWVIGVAS